MTALAALGEQLRTLAAGMLDVRGWEARTLVDDVVVGSVHDLLLDREGLVRWLDLALATGPHVLLPAGQARADEPRRRIWLPGLSADQVALLPTYPHDAGAVNAVREAALLAAYATVLARDAPVPPVGTAAPGSPSPAEARTDDPRLDPHTLFPREAG